MGRKQSCILRNRHDSKQDFLVINIPYRITMVEYRSVLACLGNGILWKQKTSKTGVGAMRYR